MKMFEIELVGFDGGTDATDGLIKWVSASDETTARTAAVEKWGEVIEVQELPGFGDFTIIDLADLRAE